MKIDNNIDTERSYYCSMKFRYLKIDLSSNTTYNCHAASPHPIDFEWLAQNPGNLFNNPTSLTERQMMLKNQRNKSCEQNCWAAEDRGAISPRIYCKGAEKTHTEIITTPEVIDITVGTDCNLSCSYCSKEYSSSWRRDIIKNGDYRDLIDCDDRYQLTIKDKVLNKISQSELKNSKRYGILFDEIQSAAPGLKKLIITGGEPLLDNQLISMLKSLKLEKNCPIIIYTGLGVSINRFKKILTEISNIPNLRIDVSAENIGNFLEFNRYGIKWKEFQEKIKILKENVDWRFHCTLTNLSIFGFREFLDFFPDHDLMLTFAYQPRFMAPYVLDKNSKNTLISDFQNVDSTIRDQILKSISQDPMESEKTAVRNFLIQFVERRSDLNLNIFPKPFLDWLKI